MAHPKTNRFTSFEFSQDELYAATRFTHGTLMLLQTLYAEAAEQRLALSINVEKPTEFIQTEACLKGTMEAYERLIMLATDTPAPAAGQGNQSADIPKSNPTI